MTPTHEPQDFEGLVSEAMPDKVSPKADFEGPFWDADFFAFGDSETWQCLPLEDKLTLLKQLQLQILTECYFIEIAGMSFAAKMSLHAQSLSERQYFCLMAAEKSAHVQMLKPFFPAAMEASKPSSFTALIGEIVNDGDRLTNLGLIQSLLEGWSSVYYQELGEYCQSPALQSALVLIADDKERYQAQGQMIFKGQKRGPLSASFCDSLAAFINNIQVGPVSAAALVLRAAGTDEAEGLLHEMGAFEATRAKLQCLRELLSRILDTPELARFDSLFAPLPEQEMARLALSAD